MKTIYVERVSSRPYIRRRGTSDHQKHHPICRKRVNCTMCAKYPCFSGIETLMSNLAETCHQFKKI